MKHINLILGVLNAGGAMVASKTGNMMIVTMHLSVAALCFVSYLVERARSDDD